MNNRSLFDIGSGGSHYGEVPRDEALENQGDAGGSSRGRRRFVRKLLGQAVYIYIFRSGQTACECWPCPLISLVFWCPEREFNEHGPISPLSDRSRIYIYIYIYIYSPHGLPMEFDPGLQFQVVGKTTAARKSMEAYRADAVILRNGWFTSNRYGNP